MRVDNSSTDDGISIATAGILSERPSATHSQHCANSPGEGLPPCSPGFRVNLPPILHERGFKPWSSQFMMLGGL
jgi:hypothetical protein